MFYCEEYTSEAMSVELTADSKYLTVGEWEGDGCVILEIK